MATAARFAAVRGLALLCLSGVAAPLSLGAGAQEKSGASGRARRILEATGVKGGLIVHLGGGDGRLTAALRANHSFVVQGLEKDRRAIGKARETVRSVGSYGPVSVRAFDGRHLPYTDGLVNLLVAEDLADVPMAEVMRVLAPNGVAYVRRGGGWTKTVKPWPAAIDEWPQYLHGADNNAVAHDSVVGPPRHLQWVSEPAWSRSHMAIPTVVSMVSSRGRLFTIEDRATSEHPFLPGRFALVARDAFNGLVLWRQPFPTWEPVTRYVKDIAMQLQRRLAAIGDTVYCTPGLEAPLTAFDAETGRSLRTYEGTERTQEFAYHRGVLYVVVGERMNAARYNIVKPEAWRGKSLGGFDPQAPFDGTGFRSAYAPQTPDVPEPTCAIVALDAESGRELWRTDELHGYTACSLAVRGQVAVYQTRHGLFCLDRATGERRWSVAKRIQGGDGTEANTVILTDRAVYAQEGKAFHAYALADGMRRWQAPIADNYEKAADLFFAAGAVWTGGSRQPTSYDPQTGQRQVVIRQRMRGPMGHDRCYRNFITDRYYINSKTGGADFVALDGDAEFPHHWTRGTCGMGVLPCNGLLYAPPYSCQCSIGAMIANFNALAPEPGLRRSDQPIPVARRVRLVKGPAYGQGSGERPPGGGEEDWPTYRGNGARGGASRARVPDRLTRRWEAKVAARPGAPVVAAGNVFVSDVDAHTLYALDVADGSVAWTYIAGARIDSPPTYHEGLVLFGSRDGRVHGLRASDGALAWRFTDLPERLIGAFGQLESAWPVPGSVLVVDGRAYFAAGRSSFLDGGIFLYALDPATGQVVHARQFYGPFDKKTGFPATNNAGAKGDILVTDGQRLYLRHKAFSLDLTDAPSAGAHVIASAGFLDDRPQHRTYWTISTGFTGKTIVRGPSGDILVTDGRDFYEVRGFPVHRHSYFDPRVRGYKLFAGTLQGRGEADGAGAAGRRRRRRAAGDAQPRWSVDIPIAGLAMALADDVVFIAGTPAYFPPDHPVEKYQAAYAGRLGGVLWAASARDGKKLASYDLAAAPCWDALAAARGGLFLSLRNGAVQCWR
ncbi:MAG: PQQ-binding-like beta-propeller repeat protein [Candidatus Brocadiia bacterium]